ncbi:MAG: Aspartate aminotransferase, mitochondrial, partial [Paramarteilia canceri]
SAGLEMETYPYLCSETMTVNFEKMKAFLQKIPKRSPVCLQACAHNPTGSDLTKDQWHQIAILFKERQLYAVFDIAYQGFATGNLDQDAYPIRYFLSNLEQYFCVCQSFAKNLGLYGERVGSLSLVCSSKSEAERYESKVKVIVRSLYSSCPKHGSEIVKLVLGSPRNFDLWEKDLRKISGRMFDMRAKLRSNLERLVPGKNFSHITDQIGMFCYTGLTAENVEILEAKHSIYMAKSGRISISGLTEANVEKVAECFASVLLKSQT